MILITCNQIIYGQEEEIKIYENDRLSNEFINELCEATTNLKYRPEVGPSYLERLINKAAGTYYKDSLQSTKSKKWYNQYAQNLVCISGEEKVDFLRLMVDTDFRSFANIIGPNRRLELNLHYRSEIDQLTLLEYINQRRITLERKHNDRRFEFQQDEEWKNIMFFYFLFSEYSIN